MAKSTKAWKVLISLFLTPFIARWFFNSQFGMSLSYFQCFGVYFLLIAIIEHGNLINDINNG